MDNQLRAKDGAELLRVKDGAELLGLKRCSLVVMEHRGLIRATRDWAGHRRFKRADLLRLKKSLFPDGDDSPEPKSAA